MVHTRAPPFNLRGTATMFEWKKQKARWKRWLYDIQYYITIWYEIKYAYYYKISYITYYIIHSYIFQIFALSLLQKADFTYHLGKTTFWTAAKAIKAIKAITADQGGLPGVSSPVGMESFYHSLQGFLLKTCQVVSLGFLNHQKYYSICLFMFLLPESLMTRWNSLFLHTLTHGQGWVGGVGMMIMWHAMDLTFLALAHMWHATQVMGRVGWVGWALLSLTHMWHATHLTVLSLTHMWHATHLTVLALAHMWHATHLTFLAPAHMWHATQVMGRVGWVGWGWWRFFHLHTCDMLRTWRFLHLHTCDMLWTWKSESKRRSVKFASVSHNKMQFTKWHSKTRLTGTQALDKVWSHLKKHVPKSLCSRSKSDRRFNPRMEQYVYSYMWRFNNRNWWKQLGQLCQQHWQKENTSANDFFFFGASYFPI